MIVTPSKRTATGCLICLLILGSPSAVAQKSVAPGGDCRVAGLNELPDEKGCGTNKPLLSDVLFERNSDQLPPQSTAALERNAKLLSDNLFPDIRVVVDGHFDPTSDEADNLGLSERRANVVRDYLISHGVAKELLTSRDHGGYPIHVDTIMEAKRYGNSRVTFTVVGDWEK